MGEVVTDRRRFEESVERVARNRHLRNNLALARRIPIAMVMVAAFGCATVVDDTRTVATVDSEVVGELPRTVAIEILNKTVGLSPENRSTLLGGGQIHTDIVPETFLRPYETGDSRLATCIFSDQGLVFVEVEPGYRGNPINRESGSLMTMNWGYDIAGSIIEWTGMPTIVI